MLSARVFAGTGRVGGIAKSTLTINLVASMRKNRFRDATIPGKTSEKEIT